MATKKKDDVSPADAAIAEATDEPVKVTFRGEEFVIPRGTFESPALGLAYASGRFNEITFALVNSAGGSFATRRFLALCKPGDTMVSVAVEFLEALSAVAGWGNSSASSDS